MLILKSLPRFSKWLALVCFLLAALALLTPVWPGTDIEANLGGLLLWAGLTEIYHGYRRSQKNERFSAWLSGALNLIIGILLTNADFFLPSAIVIFVSFLIAIDAIRYFRKYLVEKKHDSGRKWDLMAAFGNLLLLAGLIFFKGKSVSWILSMVVSLRILGTGLGILAARTGRITEVSEDLLQTWGLENNKEVRQYATQMEEEEETGAIYEREWIILFLLVLFFIHLGRMGFDRSFLGILSPLVAVIGDMVIALIITYGILGPVQLLFKRSSAPFIRHLLQWVQKVPPENRKKWGLRTATMYWLKRRLRRAIRSRKAGYSFQTAIRLGLRTGLPYAAILAAVMPVLGMSWYFDTENWASGIWDRWAASRTDAWRMAMTKATGEGTESGAFLLHPEGVDNQGDFSFIVIGDPGEGDASQLVLKDQLLKVSSHPDVKFMVISSDVIYPSGAIKDYEKKFFLPFKGVTIPIYAIPGNHDWYDAMEGFVATFYKPSVAPLAMKARIRGDLNISTTTGKRIDEMIHQVEQWKKDYQIKVGYQTAPYFSIQTNDFVFISIETGVVRQIDSLQKEWMIHTLEASKGKFVMALLGHPFYAIGEYQGSLNPAFEEIHKILQDYQVPLVMAGDTHDLEYYREIFGADSNHVMHHFVNGGGGAYLSIGTAMRNPKEMPTRDYAFFPSHDPLVDKIENLTAWYKYPAWWWTKKFNGWPFSAEWLSAAFDYNVSPFFQSFFEIKVERSNKRIRLIPYSNNGRLRWSDLTSTTGSRPSGVNSNDEVEWVIPLEPPK